MQVGILAPIRGVSLYQAMAVERLQRVEGVSVSLLFHPFFPQRGRREKRRARTLYDQWRKTFRFNTDKADLEQRVECKEAWPALNPLPLSFHPRDTYSSELTPESSSLLEILELDVLLNLDVIILRGDVLDIPKYGVWSFHHGNPHEYRGGPPGFWEIYNGSPQSGAILQKLGDRLDDGQTLRAAVLPTLFHSYLEQRRSLFAVSIDWPAEVAAEVMREGRLNIQAQPPSPAPITRWPSDQQTLIFWFKLLKANVSKFWGTFW